MCKEQHRKKPGIIFFFSSLSEDFKLSLAFFPFKNAIVLKGVSTPLKCRHLTRLVIPHKLQNHVSKEGNLTKDHMFKECIGIHNI